MILTDAKKKEGKKEKKPYRCYPNSTLEILTWIVRHDTYEMSVIMQDFVAEAELLAVTVSRKRGKTGTIGAKIRLAVSNELKA